MSKIMSVFEKLNLIEKVNEEETNVSDMNNVNVQEELEPKSIEEDNKQTELPYAEVHSEPEQQYFETNKVKNETSDKVESKQKTKLTIKEIYSLYGIENSTVNTIFMLGNFINALPESLPYEVRKKSVISIIDSSNTDLKKLLSDGEKRLDALYQFSNDLYESTTDTIEDYKKKIADLKNQISKFEEQIKIDETLLKEQNNMIKFETEKINSITDFFNNGD